MRILFTLCSLAAMCYGLFVISDTQPDLKIKVHDILNTGSFNTLEVRYSAQQIMQSQKKRLLASPKHRYLEHSMKFYPYLLMEVKYPVSERKTKEGMILWDMTDGEMVLNTKKWEKTHGFSDCMTASIDQYEFQVIRSLAAKGGAADRDSLIKMLHVEKDILEKWVDTCRRKRLIIQTGNRYRLHLEEPLFQSTPATRIDERLATKAHRLADRGHPRFSLTQIEKIARAAFGADFVIRQTSDLYLPVHCITVENPDGSIHTTYWNGLNGKEITPSLY